MKSGMKFLIESFYQSILEDTPLPIPYREILLTARLMDRIFEQVYPVTSLRDKFGPEAIAGAGSSMDGLGAFSAPDLNPQRTGCR
jgi:hypothetical protein